MKNYIPILCCSSRKLEDVFYYKNQSIKFVASPQIAPHDANVYYRPDDKIPGTNETWRDLVLKQNNPNLVPAYLLYSHEIYRNLYDEFGSHFYILSAGWGIIRADFKIPTYDITYSTAPNMPGYVRRQDNYGWKDINHLKEDSVKFGSDYEIILFAGSDYVTPFCDMTQSIPRKKKILYKSQKVRQRQGFVYEYYQTNRNTNWFYDAAAEYMDEEILKRIQKEEIEERLQKEEKIKIRFKELKSKYHELCNAYHPDHLGEEDKESGENIFCEVKDAWDNKNYTELEKIYDDYQKKKTKYVESKQELRKKEQSYNQQEPNNNYIFEQEILHKSNDHQWEEPQEEEQFYNQQELYNDYVFDQEIDQEILRKSNARQSDKKNPFMTLLKIIIACVIFGIIVKNCPTQKEPNRTPPPRVEYTLPASEGSSITVNSDVLTKYFGISYEQRQRSNLFMKDSHEYRYNGNGTWTITKKSAVNNTNKDYIDTNNKIEVENYLHGLGF